ncbi:allophanate hydrolase [Polaribacter reichenbachii]|uniref:Allophanate hydrolase n=1 Tax=Polaribacter reichenbachii TaxID=996801 RepID=A0A1B8U729_9FLAO|nr:5-oxoprolinase subunit PxpB [Polaribacter reichenbachii]APZ46349.1 allophanate hydrolase [Polaribacter reichenbachii]AUC20213.1 allophanate hydrolase [Polaribacter reichenbachii]OBY67696.1 allophanate hydrolase [Polaribacter reichenbachii]
MVKKITYKSFGANAILIEWQSIIDDKILEDILLFKEKITSTEKTEIVDIIQAYNSLTVVYKNYISNFNDEVHQLKQVYKSILKEGKENNFQWEIPVCYDVEFGIDLEEISQKSNLEIDEIIQLHSSALYKIYFIGFLPGFLYLGGLDSKIYFDRKPNPRLNVPKGAVGIGGKQTGVYPNNSAGGWNIIGKTPVDFFDVEKENPCFAKAGDFIKFKSISLDEFYQLEKEVQEKTYQLTKTLYNA